MILFTRPSRDIHETWTEKLTNCCHAKSSEQDAVANTEPVQRCIPLMLYSRTENERHASVTKSTAEDCLPRTGGHGCKVRPNALLHFLVSGEHGVVMACPSWWKPMAQVNATCSVIMAVAGTEGASCKGRGAHTGQWALLMQPHETHQRARHPECFHSPRCEACHATQCKQGAGSR